MVRYSRLVPVAWASLCLLYCFVALQGCTDDDDESPSSNATNATDEPQSSAATKGSSATGSANGAAVHSTCAEDVPMVDCSNTVAGQCPSAFPAFTTSTETAPACKVAIVGAAAGGLYSALRLVDSNTVAASDICVFEATSRVGGRLLSLRGLGPNGDLSVDAGGYRTWPEYTPVTHALVTSYLKLHAGCYEVLEDPSKCEKFNIVDASGDKIGFTTFVERMMELLTQAGVRYFPLHRLTSLSQPSGGSTTLGFSNGVSATASHSVILNIPQRPLLDVMRASGSLSGVDTRTYQAMHSVQSEIVTKVYLYYKKAWWYDLGLKNGAFSLDGDATLMPLKGRYHDGDVRCVGDDCHGFLLAVYIHDFAGETAMYFRRFQKLRNSPVTIVSDETVEGAMFLSHAHDRLKELHKYHLPANPKNLAPFDISKVIDSAPKPEFAVLATWNIANEWAGGGWYHWTDLKYLDKAMDPFESLGIYVVNEAYSKLQGWAEGSLMAADAVLEKHYSVKSPWNFTVTEMVQYVAQTKPAPACEEEEVVTSSDSGSSSSSGSTDSVLCFGGESRLRLANGSTIPLSLAEKGMNIWTGQKQGLITEVLVHAVGRVVEVALLQTPEGELLAEPNHPVLLGGQWVEIDDALHSGLLHNSSPTLERRFVERFYNLEIDGHMMDGSLHSYMVNGFVVSGLGDNEELNLRFPRQHVWKDKAVQSATEIV
mmetsp:Transcript_101720/g.175487  ORF Transcript_101720/g.175487 Transcript_101720/m.175487 type:complete len:710 (-) Transcript_101720:76-2205(-)